MHWTWIYALRCPCKLREQAESCPSIQRSVVEKAQHLLSKVGDDNLVFRGLRRKPSLKTDENESQ